MARATGLRLLRPEGLRRKRRQEIMWGVLCASPAILGFLIWQVGPIVASVFVAMTDWRIAGTPEWIGLANFEQMFTEDRLFPIALRVTASYTFGSVPLHLVVAFLLALLLNQKIKGLAVFRTVYYLPAVVPLIASSVLWLWLFNPDFGLLNAGLQSLGLPKSQWIYHSRTVIPSLILMSAWNVGPTMIIFLAGLQGVPRQLYEAVEIDGGGAFRRLWHVTIPMLTPTILFNLVLTFINTMQTFVQPYLMTEGGPNNASLLYVLYLYRKAFNESQMGYASALAWIIFLIIAGLSLLVFKSSARWVYYEGGDR